MDLFKRSREEYGREDVIDHIKMANYLMFLSRGFDDVGFHTTSVTTTSQQYSFSSRVFECKTCNRQFPSFQALGGHRASHKRPRLMTLNGQINSLSSNHGSEGSSSSLAKPKTHECSICGLEFGMGQALGGHMRRHRAGASNTDTDITKALPQQNVLVVKTATTSSKINLCFDLNLTPMENDLEIRLSAWKVVIASMVG